MGRHVTRDRDLDARARAMGRDAAQECVEVGMFDPPTLNDPAWASVRPHVRYLLGRDGTQKELELVACEWQAGVAEIWAGRFGDRRN
ncbi:MAG TPA: hypothetical protein VFH80_05805 [Solirubrobacteraceae bacterium]|nr:hypothetical protein [Solirubrobacteraceae bacterium]